MDTRAKNHKQKATARATDNQSNKEINVENLLIIWLFSLFVVPGLLYLTNWQIAFTGIIVAMTGIVKELED